MCATAIMAVRTGADQGTIIFDKGVIWSNLRNDYVLTQETEIMSPSLIKIKINNMKITSLSRDKYSQNPLCHQRCPNTIITLPLQCDTQCTGPPPLPLRLPKPKLFLVFHNKGE